MLPREHRRGRQVSDEGKKPDDREEGDNQWVKREKRVLILGMFIEFYPRHSGFCIPVLFTVAVLVAVLQDPTQKGLQFRHSFGAVRVVVVRLRAGTLKGLCWHRLP
ncbi:hypothetical protein SUGI_0245540 [Cryptomeria japonica]|nr:hypothetical protein SUGI_0245540 [Cryptomeria japonica]